VKLEVLTPKKIEFQGEVLEIILPTMAGEVSVLPQHAPLVSVLKSGRIKIKTKKEEIIIQIDGGILQVAENSATVLLKNFQI